MKIVPPPLEPPRGRWYREQDIPEQCPAVCVTDRRTEGRVMVFSLRMTFGLKSSRRTWYGKTVPAVIDAGIADAHWFYFDQYGCRRSGLDVDPRAESPIVTVRITHLLDSSLPLEVYWGEAITSLQASGAPAPGTVERIGTIRDLLERMARELDD